MSTREEALRGHPWQSGAAIRGKIRGHKKQAEVIMLCLPALIRRILVLAESLRERAAQRSKRWGGTARGVPAAHAAASPCCSPSTDCAQQSRSSTHCRRLAHHKPRSRFRGCGLLNGSRGGGAAAPQHCSCAASHGCPSDDQVRGAWAIRIDLAPPLRTPP